MYIEVTKHNGEIEYFNNVEKVTFIKDGQKTEYFNQDCINHTSTPSTIEIITTNASRGFSKAFITKVII